MAPEQGILAYLTAHRDAHLDMAVVDTRRLRSWLEDLDASSREGVRRAWLVGRVLNAEREGVGHGEVLEWEKARSKALGRTVRTVTSQ